jgi:hypothetical protein
MAIACSPTSSVTRGQCRRRRNVREMVRRTVTEVAEALSPKDYPLGCKRQAIGRDRIART